MVPDCLATSQAEITSRPEAPRRTAVSPARFRNLCDVYQGLIHADSAQNGGASAMDEHAANAGAEGAGRPSA